MKYSEWLKNRDKQLYQEIAREHHSLDEMKFLRNALGRLGKFGRAATIAAGAMLGGDEGTPLTPYAQAPKNLYYTVSNDAEDSMMSSSPKGAQYVPGGKVKLGSKSSMFTRDDDNWDGDDDGIVTQNDKGEVDVVNTSRINKGYGPYPEIFSKPRTRYDWKADVRKQFDQERQAEIEKMLPGAGGKATHWLYGEPEVKEVDPATYEKTQKTRNFKRDIGQK